MTRKSAHAVMDTNLLFWQLTYYFDNFSKTSIVSSSDSGLILENTCTVRANLHINDLRTLNLRTLDPMEGKGGAIFCKMSSAQKHGLPPLALTPVVTKPPSLTTIQKHGIPSASERALHALLKKRHDKYLLKLADSTKSSDEISTPPIHWSLPDKGNNI